MADYKGYTVPALTDVPDFPQAMQRFADSIEEKFAAQYGTWRQLPSGSWDANQETAQGVSVAATAAQTLSYTNLPRTGLPFILEVLSANDTNKLQRVTYYDGRMFARYYRVNNTWGAWTEYQRVEDSGEIGIPPGSNWNARGDWPLTVRKLNGVLFIAGGVEVKGSLQPGVASDLGQTPSGYRPARLTSIPFASSTNISGIAIWGTDGRISFTGNYAAGMPSSISGLFILSGSAIAG